MKIYMFTFHSAILSSYCFNWLCIGRRSVFDYVFHERYPDRFRVLRFVVLFHFEKYI